ncbi:MAG TPA: hypothetical protein VGM98_15995 [Schlesneria sp.]
MNVPQDLQQFVGQQLLLGNYESVDDLIVDALTLLRDKRQAELFAEIDIGRQQIERGECVHLETEDDVREFFAEIKRGRAARSEPAV